MSTDISNLRKFVSPEIIFGAGARKTVANYAHNFGARKVLVVSDPGVKAAGWLNDIETHLAEEHIDFVTYTNVSPNPRAEEIMQGAELYREHDCNVIVAIGGGSLGGLTILDLFVVPAQGWLHKNYQTGGVLPSGLTLYVQAAVFTAASGYAMPGGGSNVQTGVVLF